MSFHKALEREVAHMERVLDEDYCDQCGHRFDRWICIEDALQDILKSRVSVIPIHLRPMLLQAIKELRELKTAKNPDT